MGRKKRNLDTACAWDDSTLVINILGTPGAKRDTVGKIKGHQLCVSVTPALVAGRATDHMVRFLAEKFGVKIDGITVVFGRYNVNKQMRIKSPKKFPAAVKKYLSAKQDYLSKNNSKSAQ